MSEDVEAQIRKIFNEINEKNHPIGKRSWLHEVENLKHRVLAVLADHVCIGKQQLQDLDIRQWLDEEYPSYTADEVCLRVWGEMLQRFMQFIAKEAEGRRRQLQDHIDKFPMCEDCELWNAEKERCDQTWGLPCPKDTWFTELKQYLGVGGATP